MEVLQSYAPMLPEIAIAVGAMLVLMLGVFRDKSALPEPGVDYVSGWLPIIVLVAGAALVVNGAGPREVLFDGAFISDGFSRFSKILILGGAALVLVMSLDTLARAK